MLAQRYPNECDGIAAAAPAINWVEFFPNIQWPQQVMNEMNQYPFPCELDALTTAAIATCDGLDGVEDNIIGEAVECLNPFNPFSMVVTTIATRLAPVSTSARRLPWSPMPHGLVWSRKMENPHGSMSFQEAT